jgi:septum formation protein
LVIDERGQCTHQVVVSHVTFQVLSDEQILAYLATGEPSDKAGAYAVQGLGSALVARVEGSYTNIVGLPIEEVLQVLKAVGVTPSEKTIPA